MGDATEDMVEHFNDNKNKDVDQEDLYKMAAVVMEYGGLDVTLSR